jgi:hypothetical protein
LDNTCFCKNGIKGKKGNMQWHIAECHSDYWATLDNSTLPKAFTSNIDFQKKTIVSDNICLHCNEVVPEETMKTHWTKRKHKNKLCNTDLFFYQGKNNIIYFQCNLCSFQRHLTVKQIKWKSVQFLELEKHFNSNHKEVDWKSITETIVITKNQKYDMILSRSPEAPLIGQTNKFNLKTYSIKKDGYLFKCVDSNCNLEFAGHYGLGQHLKIAHEQIWNSFENPMGNLSKNWNLFTRDQSSVLTHSQTEAHAHSQKYHFETFFHNSSLRTECNLCKTTIQQIEIRDHLNQHKLEFDYIYFVYRKINIIYFACNYCSYVSNDHNDIVKHYRCVHLGIQQKEPRKKYKNTNPINLEISRLSTKFNTKIECNLGALYNNKYSGITQNEILSKSNQKQIFKALGFVWLPYSNILVNNNSCKMCDYCYNMMTEHYMPIHKQICHTADDNEDLVMCPDYANCKFAISKIFFQAGKKNSFFVFFKFNLILI